MATEMRRKRILIISPESVPHRYDFHAGQRKQSIHPGNPLEATGTTYGIENIPGAFFISKLKHRIFISRLFRHWLSSIPMLNDFSIFNSKNIKFRLAWVHFIIGCMNM